VSALIQIQLRRDTAANWASNNPILAQGEPALETDTQRFKIGDGSTVWASLPYQQQTYTHTQGAAATGWYISHNLLKFPAVTVVDSSGNLVEGAIQYINNNSLEINFTAAFSGKAYLN